MIAALFAVALADEPIATPEPLPLPRWEVQASPRRARTGEILGRTGAWSLGLGAASIVTGGAVLAVGNYSAFGDVVGGVLVGTGALGVVTGTPLVAIGPLMACRARARGPCVPGVVSVVLLGAGATGLVLAAGLPQLEGSPALAAAVAVPASWVAAGIQGTENRRDDTDAVSFVVGPGRVGLVGTF